MECRDAGKHLRGTVVAGMAMLAGVAEKDTGTRFEFRCTKGNGSNANHGSE